MTGTVQEAARVLDRGGHLCICVAHPVTDLGRFLTTDDDAPYTVRSPYFERVRVDDFVERDGLQMTFRGWTYTLEDYASALAGAGLVIDAIREPRPGPAPERFKRWQRIPMFLNLRAVRQ